MAEKFRWHDHDITDKLPLRLTESIKDVAAKYLKLVVLKPQSVTSRELNKDLKIEILLVDENVIKEKLSWLYERYIGYFHLCHMSK